MIYVVLVLVYNIATCTVCFRSNCVLAGRRGIHATICKTVKSRGGEKVQIFIYSRLYNQIRKIKLVVADELIYRLRGLSPTVPRSRCTAVTHIVPRSTSINNILFIFFSQAYDVLVYM